MFKAFISLVFFFFLKENIMNETEVALPLDLNSIANTFVFCYRRACLSLKEPYSKKLLFNSTVVNHSIYGY